MPGRSRGVSSVSALASFVLLGAFVIGCGGSGDMPDLGQVKGFVTLSGSPLADAEVTFLPVKGAPSTGYTNENGEYELDYNIDVKGAVIGKHTVAIRTYQEEDSEEGEPIVVPERVPAIYNEDSELTADVKTGGNEFNFDLEAGELPEEGNIAADDGDGDDDGGDDDE